VTRLTRKLRRVLFVIPYVAGHPEGVPLAELAAMLGSTRRELEREIASLLLVGVPGGGGNREAGPPRTGPLRVGYFGLRGSAHRWTPVTAL